MLWLLRDALVALYPSGSGWPGLADCGLDEFLARFRKESPPLLWWGLVAGVLVYQLTPVLTVFLPLPAFLLPVRLKDRHAQRVTVSRLYLVRQAVFLVKLCAGLCWGADPAVRARLNLRPLPPDPGTWRAR